MLYVSTLCICGGCIITAYNLVYNDTYVVHGYCFMYLFLESLQYYLPGSLQYDLHIPVEEVTYVLFLYSLLYFTMLKHCFHVSFI